MRIILCLLVLFLPLFVHSTEYPDNLYKGILREAADQDKRGMIAVACVVRNRFNKGMNHGLVGLRRKRLEYFVSKQEQAKINDAKEAVHKVFNENHPDITYGADHFESIKFKEPWWAKTMIKTVRINEHQFYKSKK